MQAYTIERYGSDGQLTLQPQPECGADDVLVKIHAASINPLDSKISSGEFKLLLPYKMPLILGNDFAGVVIAVGRNVSEFQIGDAVYAKAPQERIGCFAEYIAINKDALAHKPLNLTMEQATAVPLVALTAWQALVETANLQPGQKVLIHAGSGGVGTMAIQLAKQLGAFVATTTSTTNVDWVKALGVDVVVDYKTQDFSQLLQNYDVVLCSLGGDTLQQSLKVIKPGGMLISISGPPTPEFAATQKAPWLLQQIMRLLSFSIRRNAQKRGISYRFVFMRSNGQQLQHITSLIEAGKLKPIIDKVFSFTDIADALAYSEQGRVKGKTVIKIAD